LTPEEEKKVLNQAKASTSANLHVAIVVALNTGLRDSEIRNLQWKQIDFFKQLLTVGKSKTAEGAGRTVPMNSELVNVLANHAAWYEKALGKAKGAEFVFPAGAHGKYDTGKPVSSMKTAWNNVRSKTRCQPGFTTSVTL
jgi:integrase